MKVRQARFVESSPSHRDGWSLPEIALTGRSNVGKSSLINALLGRKNLAKTSSTPGKTQLINRFCIDESWHLIDLPGYGWARVSQRRRVAWRSMVQRYLSQSKQLILVLLLIDSRRTPQALDLEFAGWLQRHTVPFQLVFTKGDKISTNVLNRHIHLFADALQGVPGHSPLGECVATSSKTRLGLETLGKTIGAKLAAFLDSQ